MAHAECSDRCSCLSGREISLNSKFFSNSLDMRCLLFYDTLPPSSFPLDKIKRIIQSFLVSWGMKEERIGLRGRGRDNPDNITFLLFINTCCVMLKVRDQSLCMHVPSHQIAENKYKILFIAINYFGKYLWVTRYNIKVRQTSRQWCNSSSGNASVLD